MSSKVVIFLKQSTPALIGSYDPTLVDKVFYIRPSSIKGIWRWFARALIAGALYDLGYLQAIPHNGLWRISKPRGEIEPISYFVGKIMGLGYVDPRGQKNESSRFFMRIDVVKPPRISRVHGRSIHVEGRQVLLQRLSLLSLGRGRSTIEYFENGKFKLTLTRVRSHNRDCEELALRSLILALSLSGIGKGARKGLGSLDIVNVRGIQVESDFSQFLERTYDLAKKVVEAHVGMLELRHIKVPDLPPLSLFSKRTCCNMPLSAIYVLSNVSWISIHNFFLRSERCKVLYGNYRKPDNLRKKFEAWILGLPRSQRGTGYIMKEGERRASPIFVVNHNDDHIFRGGVYLTVFLSCDWPLRLEWKGDTSSREINIDINTIVSAMSDALNELWRYLKICPPRPIWP